MNIQSFCRPMVPLLRAAIVAAITLTTHGAAVAQNSAPAAAAETMRAEVGKPLQAAQEKIQAKQYKEALAKIGEVDLVPNKTPYENFFIERMRGTAAMALGEHAITAKSFEALLATGRLTPAERTLYAEAITGAYYNLKDYKQAAGWAARAIKDGSVLPQMRMLQVQSLYLADDFTGAKTEVIAALAADDTAGRVPTEEMLRMLGRTALKLNDEAGYIDALERLVSRYPKSDYWADLIARTARKPAMTDRNIQDLFRLQLALGSKLPASEYLFLAQNALQAGFPIDARQILEKGFVAGVLGAQPEHKQLRDKVSKEADDDLKNMARTAAEAEQGKEGPGLFNAGLNFVISGDKEKGLPMMERGIKRAGIKRPQDAKLRLGMAYAMNGESGKAADLLASVTGADGIADVAKLWAIFARQPRPMAPAAK